MKGKRVVVIDIAGLGMQHFEDTAALPRLSSLVRRGRLLRMKPVFPAVTLPVQASLTTGLFPDRHGVVANGFYFREDHRIAFWEQAAALVGGERIWERLKRKSPSLKTASLFLQNTLYASCDAVITPKPLHTGKGMVQWCYSKPPGLYEEICEKRGEFDLLHYWGPLASIESSRWIAGASLEVMDRIRPDLLFVYLPHLDYCLQRHGPGSPAVHEELARVDAEAGRIIDGIGERGLSGETVFIVLSEYAFSAVTGDIPLNRIFRENGLFAVRTIAGREYPDFELTPAFAMVDHQVAHVYCKPGHLSAVRNILERTDGVDHILQGEGKKEYRIGHQRSGDLVAVSARDRWFSYYWWEERVREPDFAGQVDIHRKPGYDPLELFIERGEHGTFRVPQDTGLIKGSHGYPPLGEEDMIPLLLSGEGTEALGLPDALCIADIPSIIEEILFPGAQEDR
ncbi:MAG: alkaline phosphatase family protein [Alphaproteobacteria bacterium]|uniref:Alkaline phosphatase family protein n=1 Tax=Candidatus Nitrobium versatile TaxID=2884831 RepID=A0A953M353_9BACT|nr:alkaline phosphatase family protein [Candidatus Nitrobium versatile]